ncbi:MAG: DNA gyrase inhibitor YacG [Candidatus Magnetoovum sp. WYHC-5]|nr:DNA gyrase inhibitor YacG [Candidatus Magnetoovum sp. WYHC-5]
MKVKCPKCAKESLWDGNPYRPFCSKRCKIMDLAAWAKEEYIIEGAVNEEDDNNLISNNDDRDL